MGRQLRRATNLGRRNTTMRHLGVILRLFIKMYYDNPGRNSSGIDNW